MSNELTQEQIDFLNEGTKGTWTYNSSTDLVDVEGDFDHRKRVWYNTQKNFFGIKFGKVSGDFLCSQVNLPTLEGSPHEVGGDFKCKHLEPNKYIGHLNKIPYLTSLEGAPKKVGGSFNCEGHAITSLKGSPQKINGDFNCSDNCLTSLEGAPKEVSGNFDCNYNELTSLKGAPKNVGGTFDCSWNKLTSLECAPQKVGGYFYWRHGNRFSLEEIKKFFNSRSSLLEIKIFLEKTHKYQE